MRLFVAIPLNEELRDRVGIVQETFRRERVQGNFTPRENLHITLAFIGEYGNPAAVMDALEQVSFEPFTLRMDRTGRFGDLWWTGFNEAWQLEALAGKVRRVLAEAGIPYDRKRFRPHVTILRKPVYPEGRKIEEMGFGPAEMTVSEFCLMQSTRGKHGMIYTELGSITARE